MYKAEKNTIQILLLCVVLIGVYYYRPTNLYFLADDFFHIPESVKNIWIQQNSVRPIGNITLLIDFFFSNSNALGYHISNILIHSLNSFLVAILSKKLFNYFTILPSTNWLTWIVGIFFFVYPFHSEAVFWIIGRSGSLGALFFVAALICFLLRERSLLYSIASILFFQLAIFSYESSWLFPLFICLIYFFKQGLKKILRSDIIYFALVWLLLLINLFLISKATVNLFSNYEASAFIHFNIKLLLQNFIKLFARTLLPPFFSNLYFIVALVVVFVVCALLIILFLKKNVNSKFFYMLSVLWLLSYLPYLSIGIDTHGTEGERYLYLPSVFFCLWLVYILYSISNTRHFFISIILLMSFQLYFLQKSRAYYVKASDITKTTINQIKLLESKEKLYFDNLPQYNKGAVVFRRGLYNAIRWLYPNQKYDVVVVSIDDSDIKPRDKHINVFEVLYSDKNFPKAVTAIKEWNGIEQNKIRGGGIIFNPKKDAWFSFNEWSLTIVR